MLEALIVSAVVAAALFFTARALRRGAKGSCAGCRRGGGCPAARDGDPPRGA